MKSSTRLAVIALAIGVALTGGASAQDAADQNGDPAQAGAKHAPASPEQQLEHLTKRLQLTPDQVEKIGPILQNRRENLESLRSDPSTKGPDRRAKAEAITQASEQQVEAILTDSQRQQYEQQREKALQRRMDKHPQADANGAN
jgi:periplasmic protein CpxP/Spy